MALGFIHSMQTDSDIIVWTLLSLVIVNVLIILIEAKAHPDLS